MGFVSHLFPPVSKDQLLITQGPLEIKTWELLLKKSLSGVSAAVQWMKPALEPLASPSGRSLAVSAAPLPIQLPASAPGEAVDEGPSLGTPVPMWETKMGCLDIMAFWGINQ